jgi:hypothetical protein
MSMMISGLGARLKATAGATLVYTQGSMSAEVARSLATVANATFDLNRWGVAYDGTDETSKVNAFLGAVGTTKLTLVISGNVKISSNVTFPPNVELAFASQGAIVGTAGTELVQVQSQIVAGRHQIFSNCVARTTIGATCYPEWWAASGTDDLPRFTSAVSFLQNTGGWVDCAPVTYNLSANFNVGTGTAGSTGQRTQIVGHGDATILNFTAASATGIQALGYSSTLLQGLVFRDFQITKSVAATGGVGLFLNYTSGAHVENVKIAGMIESVLMQRAPNTYLRNVTGILSGAVNNQRGFDLDGGGTGAGGNASSEFWSCYVDASGVTGTGAIGFYGHGSYVSDLAFHECETTFCRGWHMDGSTAANTGNEDIQWINCRSDMVPDFGIYAYHFGQSGSNDSMLTILGGWFDAGTSGTPSLLYFDTCQGVSVHGVQLYAAQNAANTTHATFVNCVRFKMIGCTHREGKYGVSSSGSGYGQIIAGDFYCSSANTATAFINFTGAARVLANGNMFDGYATKAVVFDATSSGCGIVNNVANVANITTRFTNGGSSPVGAADGSTGNNSGV